METWIEVCESENLMIEDAPKNKSWEEFFELMKSDEVHCNNMKRLKRHILRNSGVMCYPWYGDIYRTMIGIDVLDVRCVIIGQDPYHGCDRDGTPQACGISFGVREGFPFPPSLKNIIKEMNNEGLENDGNVIKWVDRGVLMLNSSLTVHKGYPGGHLKYWEYTTDSLIEFICKKRTGGECDSDSGEDNSKSVVFMLWGSYAKNKRKIISKYMNMSEENKKNKIYVIECTHPSPMGANQGGWFGSNCFINCNKLLGYNLF